MTVPDESAQPIRVVHIIARMNVGGPAQIITGLLRQVDPGQFEQHVIVGSAGDDEKEWFDLRDTDLRDDPRFLRIASFGRTISPLRDLSTVVRLIREIRRLRPDVVQTHTAKAGMLGRIAARSARVPTIIHTYHGHTMHGYFPRSIVWFFVRIERWLGRRTDRLITVGTRVRDELIAAGIGVAAQYVVVPPGVPDPGPLPLDSARGLLDLPKDREIVTFVGRLTRVKRPDRFLEVAESIAASRPDTIFLIVGDGELRSDLESRVDVADVRFLGWRPDVSSIYAASDLVVLTSDNEGMPVVLVEASIVGRACVTTDVGSASEVVKHGETGLVVSTRVEDITAAALRLLGDPAMRQTFGANARERTLERFGTAAVAQSLENVYRARSAATRR
jgi:glycosyltransferase involved in cell wall biosynthesis